MQISDLPLGQGRCRRMIEMANAPKRTHHCELALALSDTDYVKTMFRLSGALSAARNSVLVRKALIHLLANGSIDWNRDTLDDLRSTVANAINDPRVETLRDNLPLKTLPDMILFAQSEGLAPTHGWSKKDVFAAHDFKIALRAEGLDDHASQRDFRFIAHFIIWARLHAVSHTIPSDNVIEQFAKHDCVCGLSVSSTTPKGRKSRRLAMRRWRRFLNGEAILTEHGNVRRENRAPPAPLAPSVAEYKKHLLKD